MTSRSAHLGAVASSCLTSTITGFRGALVVHAATQPPKPIVLYEYESCPYCRSVREALTALHLDVEIRPCPERGNRFRPEAERVGGEQRFPFLVDENTGAKLYGSKTITDYLFRTYAGRSAPRFYRPTRAHHLQSSLASGSRYFRGRYARPSRLPAAPLHLTSFESSPFSRLVREALCELELPYTLHNLGKERWDEAGPAVRRIAHPYTPTPGGKRAAFQAAHGRVQVPFLEDPNTSRSLFESKRILAYLEETYAG